MGTQRATMREQVLVVTRRLDDWRRIVELISSLFRPPLTSRPYASPVLSVLPQQLRLFCSRCLPSLSSLPAGGVLFSLFFLYRIIFLLSGFYVLDIIYLYYNFTFQFLIVSNFFFTFFIFFLNHGNIFTFFGL